MEEREQTNNLVVANNNLVANDNMVANDNLAASKLPEKTCILTLSSSSHPLSRKLLVLHC